MKYSKEDVVREYLVNPRCEVVGKKFGIGRESVRRIIKNAGIKMRRGPRSKPTVKFSENENAIFDANLYLVNLAINQINGRLRARMAGMEVDDLISAGMIGLWKSIANFDSSRGNKLSTPALKSIKCQMFEAIELARYGRRKRSEHQIDHSKFKTYLETDEENN